MEKTLIRGVERATGHHWDTVSRYYHLIGEHAEILNECYLWDRAPGRACCERADPRAGLVPDLSSGVGTGRIRTQA